MRAANRSLVLVIAFLLSVVAVPTYAADDSPGLLETVTSTVDSVAKPLLPAKPAPDPTSAGPVTQLTGLVDSALDEKTSLSKMPLVATVDGLLTTHSDGPSTPEPSGVETEAPVAADDDGSGSVAAIATSTSGELALASRPFETVLEVGSFSASGSSDPVKAEPVATEAADISGTSTLPDGGSPLTLAWLVLATAFTMVGATIVRRVRTH